MKDLSAIARRLRTLAARLALLAGTVLAALALLEIAARLFTNTEPPLTEKDALLGQRYVRDFQGQVFIPEAERKVALRFNHVGFRGPDRPFEKPAGVRRVAILGDSLIASAGVDEEQTLVAQLEQTLNRAQSGVKWEVLNFGVPGSCPGQELVQYRNLVARFQPDLVICAFFVGNDLSDNCRRLSNNPRIYFDLDSEGHLQQAPFSANKATLSLLLNRWSRFYVWQKDAVNGLRHLWSEAAGQLEPGQWIYCSEPAGDVEYAWKLSEELVREFQREATRRGSQFLLVMIPSCEQIYADNFQVLRSRAGKQAATFDADYPDRRLGKLCSREGIPLLTFTAEFRAAAPHASSHLPAEWLYLKGYGHLNERGNTIAAERLYQHLAEGNPRDGARRPLLSQD
jgi:lysophospholipase L1-like esterase